MYELHGTGAEERLDDNVISALSQVNLYSLVYSAVRHAEREHNDIWARVPWTQLTAAV